MLNDRAKTVIRNLAIIGTSVFIIAFVFRWAVAGSLTPSSSPAGTFSSIEDSYNALVGTFDSSSVTASESGNAFEISKCIINQLTGGVCS